MSENPHLHFFNSQRGYVKCEVTPQQWRTDYRVLPYVSWPGAPIATRASFVVANGSGAWRRRDMEKRSPGAWENEEYTLLHRSA